MLLLGFFIVFLLLITKILSSSVGQNSIQTVFFSTTSTASEQSCGLVDLYTFTIPSNFVQFTSITIFNASIPFQTYDSALEYIIFFTQDSSGNFLSYSPYSTPASKTFYASGGAVVITQPISWGPIQLNTISTVNDGLAPSQRNPQGLFVPGDELIFQAFANACNVIGKGSIALSVQYEALPVAGNGLSVDFNSFSISNTIDFASAPLEALVFDYLVPTSFNSLHSFTTFVSTNWYSAYADYSGFSMQLILLRNGISIAQISVSDPSDWLAGLSTSCYYNTFRQSFATLGSLNSVWLSIIAGDHLILAAEFNEIYTGINSGGGWISVAYDTPPFSSSLTPFSSSQTPYSSSQTPYSSSQTPYSSSQTPYSSSQTPYSSSQTPYSSSQTPYSSSQTPYSSSQTPYSSSQTEFSSSQTSYSSSSLYIQPNISSSNVTLSFNATSDSSTAWYSQPATIYTAIAVAGVAALSVAAIVAVRVLGTDYVAVADKVTAI